MSKVIEILYSPINTAVIVRENFRSLAGAPIEYWGTAKLQIAVTATIIVETDDTTMLLQNLDQ